MEAFIAEDEAMARVEQHPSTSTRRVAGQLGVSHTTIWKIWNRAGLHPYHKRKVQALNQADYPHRLHFSETFLDRCQQDPDFPSLVMFTDEATLNQDGICNSKNNIHWSYQNPHVTHERGRQVRFKVNLWAGMLGNHIIGPYILPQNLNADNYGVFLREVLPELLDDVPLQVRRDMWFHQDGAPAHTALRTRNLLNQMFPNKWIGRFGTIPWPARSPDLNPLDFYFWGRLKELVYSTPVLNEEDLIARIAAAVLVMQTDDDIRKTVQEEVIQRCRACIQANGSNFEQLL